MGLAEIAALLGLGAFHGLNPSMGWLFAVAIGLQERSASALLRALVPIVIGHLVSMTVVAVAASVGASVTTSQVIAVAGGVALVGLGMFLLLRKRHFRWVGMRLTPWQLAAWSFLMASVHGAGLMVVPIVALSPSTVEHAGHAVTGSVGDGVAAALVHTVGMTAVAAVLALWVYHVVGVRILRTAWVNMDRLWAFVMVGAGCAAVIVGML
jgi:hypothetical protein